MINRSTSSGSAAANQAETGTSRSASRFLLCCYRIGRRLAMIVASAVLAAGFGTASAQTIQILNLWANDLIYDPVSQRIYVSVPSFAGPGLGNTITTVNPFTAQIERSVFVGSEPGPLAVSDDGQYLYVGLWGVGAVRRYHIPTATPGLQIPLGIDPRYGPLYAYDIEVLPGNPNAFAVSRMKLSVTPPHHDIAVFDDDVMRPTTTYILGRSNRIVFSDSAATLYGRDDDNGISHFETMSVTADGVTVVASQQSLTRHSFGVDIEFEQGIVYASSGEAIDPAAMRPLGLYDAVGYVEADASLGKVYFLSDHFNGTASLMTFDMATFLLSDTFQIKGIIDVARGLIRWGDDGLAFRTTGGQVFLLRAITPETRDPVCDVEMSNSVYFDGDAVVARIRLANQGPVPLSVEARLWFDWPGGPPVPKDDLHPTGLFDLPVGYDRIFGPVTLAAVTSNLPRGDYAFSCLLMDPVTGDKMADDVNPFTVQ